MNLLLMMLMLMPQDTPAPLAYTVSGSGRPLLLLPGLGNTSAVFDDLAAALPPGIQCVRVEAPGVAGSAPAVPFDWPTLVEDAVATMAHLGHRRFAVLGLSWGSFWAQQLALTHPDQVERLILVGSTLGGPTHVAPAPEVLQALIFNGGATLESQTALVSMAFHPDWVAAHADRVQTMAAARLAQPFPQGVRAGQLTLGVAFDTTATAQNISCPTLVLHGADDRVVPLANGRRIVEVVPHATWVALPDSGHVCVIDRAAEAAAAVARFLEVP